MTKTLFQTTPEISNKTNIDASRLGVLTTMLSRTYTNPIRAVVREYVTNALETTDDAITQGLKPKAVEVTLPSDKSPVFICKDNGLGMTKDQILSQLGTLLTTTKDGDNSKTGKYGIGSMSGMAVSDRISIISVAVDPAQDNKRVRTIAQIVKSKDETENDANLCEIIKCEIVADDTDLGTTISIPVTPQKPQDRHVWTTVNIDSTLQKWIDENKIFLDTLPHRIYDQKLLNVTNDPRECKLEYHEILKNPTPKIISTELYKTNDENLTNKLYIRIGYNVYYVDKTKYRINTPRLFWGSYIVVTVDKNTVDITQAREALEENDKTKTFLSNDETVEKAIQKFAQHIMHKTVSDCKNPWEALEKIIKSNFNVQSLNKYDPHGDKTYPFDTVLHTNLYANEKFGHGEDRHTKNITSILTTFNFEREIKLERFFVITGVTDKNEKQVRRALNTWVRNNDPKGSQAPRYHFVFVEPQNGIDRWLVWGDASQIPPSKDTHNVQLSRQGAKTIPAEKILEAHRAEQRAKRAQFKNSGPNKYKFSIYDSNLKSIVEYLTIDQIIERYDKVLVSNKNQLENYSPWPRIWADNGAARRIKSELKHADLPEDSLTVISDPTWGEVFDAVGMTKKLRKLLQFRDFELNAKFNTNFPDNWLLWSWIRKQNTLLNDILPEDIERIHDTELRVLLREFHQSDVNGLEEAFYNKREACITGGYNYGRTDVQGVSLGYFENKYPLLRLAHTTNPEDLVDYINLIYRKTKKRNK